MRWTRQPNPKVKDLRTIEFFAWLPVTIGLETRWLENVCVQQIYTEVTYFTSDIYDVHKTTSLEWVNLQFIENINIFNP